MSSTSSIVPQHGLKVNFYNCCAFELDDRKLFLSFKSYIKDFKQHVEWTKVIVKNTATTVVIHALSILLMAENNLLL